MHQTGACTHVRPALHEVMGGDGWCGTYVCNDTWGGTRKQGLYEAAECTADWGLLSPIRTETRCVDLPYIMGDND